MTKGHTADGTPEPLVEEVIGAVHPSGAGGGKAGQDVAWNLNFSFAAWRRVGGPVEGGELLVTQPGLTDDDLRRLMSVIRPYDILRVRLRFTRPAGEDGPVVGLLTELLGPETADPDLNALVDEMRTPVLVHHPAFGTFTLDRGLNWYTTTVPWAGRSVQLCLSCDSCADVQELFRTAEALWDRQAEWDARVRGFAAGKLLDLKNQVWLQQGESGVTPDGFKTRMVLEEVGVYSSEHFEFTFDDGDLFWGHIIQVSGTLADGLTHAGIAG